MIVRRRHKLLAGFAALAVAVVGAAFTLVPIRPPAASGPYGVATAPVRLVPSGPTAPTPLGKLWYPYGPTKIAGRLPVLVYFPSWSGTANENRLLIRELVSHGFVVLAIRYPTSSEIAHSSAGRTLRGEPAGGMAFDTTAAFERTLALGDEKVRQRAVDAADALARLGEVDGGAGPPALAHRLALDRVGIFGFSLGGAAAVQAAWLDRRFAAAVNLDGWLFGDAARDGIHQPYLQMSDDSPLPSDADLTAEDPARRNSARLDRDDYDRQIAGLKRHGGFIVTVAGSQHINFSDGALRSRFRRLTGAGPIAPVRAQQIVAAYVLGFFSWQLEGGSDAMFRPGAAPFPEARLQVFEPAAPVVD